MGKGMRSGDRAPIEIVFELFGSAGAAVKWNL